MFRCQNLADLSVGKKWMMKLKPVLIHKIFAYWIWNVNGKCEVPAQSLAHNVYERATGHHSTFFSDVRIQQNCLQERSEWCNLKSVEINKTFVYWILKVNGGGEVRAQSSPHHVNEKVRQHTHTIFMKSLRKGFAKLHPHVVVWVVSCRVHPG